MPRTSGFAVSDDSFVLVHSKKGETHIEGPNIKNAADREHEAKSFGYICIDLVGMFQSRLLTKPLAGKVSPYFRRPTYGLQVKPCQRLLETT
jgi:hypothetical protein